MAGKKPHDVTDAELAVLRSLWQLGLATIRQITAAVYPGNSESDYATVKKLLARLEKKHMVRRDRTDLAHRFEAAVTLEDLVARRLQKLADNLCGGSQTPLLMHLIENQGITAGQQEKLRDLIDEISHGGSHKQKPRRKPQ